MVTLQVIASLGADVELGDVTGAFLESAELNRQGGKLFLRQPSGGLPGLHHQQLLEIRLPLYGLNDSPKVVLGGFQSPSEHWLAIFRFGRVCLNFL